jgi:hypothetical protein
VGTSAGSGADLPEAACRRKRRESTWQRVARAASLFFPAGGISLGALGGRDWTSTSRGMGCEVVGRMRVDEA